MQDQQIQLKINKIFMHKSTLVQILFQGSQSPKNNKNNANKYLDQKQVQNKQYEYLSKTQSKRKTNKMIKITQFNSSLVIGDQKVTHNLYSTHSSNSPQKNFNIKKLGDLKNKVALSAQRIVEIELKKKQKTLNIQLNQTCLKNNGSSKQPIQKILMGTKCSIKNEIPNIEALTSSVIFPQDYDEYSTKSPENYLYKYLYSQRVQINDSKQLLDYGYKTKIQRSSKKVGVDIFNEKMQDIDPNFKRRVESPRKIYTRHINDQKKYQQNIQRQKRQLLELKKELNKNYAKPFIPPQNISAYSYIIYEADAKKQRYLRKNSIKGEQNPQITETRKMLINSHKVLVSLNSRSCVEIASLTKIMTCILIIDLAKKFNVKLNQEFITIGIFQENIGGTSAHIQKGEVYNVQQLLYGLMLPSGNDASLALAVWGGKLLLQEQQNKKQSLSKTNTTNTSNNDSKISHFKKKQCYERFIKQMNVKAVQLNMQKTTYANSHGLSNYENKSCPYDLAVLCQYAMSNKEFKQIVSCKCYEAEINIESQTYLPAQRLVQRSNSKESRKILKKQISLNLDGTMELEQMKDMAEIYENQFEDQDIQEKMEPANSTKLIKWENTHQLIQDKSNLYTGIKTGITNTAGPCLSSCLEINGRRFIIIVLNCKSMKYRFKDTQNLRKWLFNKQSIKFRQKVVIQQEQSELQLT